MKKMILALILAVIIPFTVCFSSPAASTRAIEQQIHEYTGKDYDLYTVALYNVIGAGESSWLYDSQYIVPLETDQYGRRLFFFSTSEPSILAGNRIVYSLCICQKSELRKIHSSFQGCVNRFDDEYTYYYEDICAVPCDEKGLVPKETLTRFLSDNDWEQPLNESKMKMTTIVKTVRAKPENDRVYPNLLRDEAEAFNSEYCASQTLCSDCAGRELILMRGYNSDNTPVGNTTAYMIEPEREDSQGQTVKPRITASIELTDDMLLDYTEVIVKFKTDNKWDVPFRQGYTLPTQN